MSNTSTPANTTATNNRRGTVANSIRGAVNNKLNTVSKDIDIDYRKKLLTSAVRAYRTDHSPNSGSDYLSKPIETSNEAPNETSNKTYKDLYAIAVRLTANEKGILPKGNDDNYTDEQLNQDLRPAVVMAHLAKQIHLQTNNRDASKDHINQALDAAYEGNTDDPNDGRFNSLAKEVEAPDDDISLEEFQTLENLGIPVHISDKKREEFRIRAEAEKARALQRKYAGDMAGTDEHDHDLERHKDDDKIKVTDGDILDYLMKEVLLPSWSWCIEKTAGIGGVILYEIGKQVKEHADPYWQAAKRNSETFFGDIENALFGNPTLTETEKLQLKSFIEFSEANLTSAEKELNCLKSEDFYNLNHITDGFVTHIHFFDFDEKFDENSEHKGVIYVAGKRHKIEDLMVSCGYTDRDKFIKEWKEVIDQTREAQIKHMLNKLNSDGNSNVSRTDVETYYDARIKEIQNNLKQKNNNGLNDEQAKENALKDATEGQTKEKALEDSKETKLRDERFNQAFNDATHEMSIATQIAPILETRQAEAEIFATYYAVNEIIKEYSATDKNKRPKSKEDFEAMINTHRLSGEQLFYALQQGRLLEGKLKEPLSNDELIGKIKKTAEDNIEKMKKGEQIEKTDFRETILNPDSGKTIEKTLADLADEYNDGSVDEELNNELTNLGPAEIVDTTNQESINKRREKVEEIKTRMKPRDKSIKKSELQPLLPQKRQRNY